MALDSPRNANGMHHNHKYHSFCLRRHYAPSMQWYGNIAAQ